MGTVSLHEVAKHAGVSIATVSHVVNGTKNVSQKTRETVEKSIRELGYRPNVAARSFKTGRKNVIAFIVPDIANAFFSSLIDQVETVLAAEGYRLIISNTKETKERERESIALLSSGLVDGFIIASTLDDYEELRTCLPPDMPAVLIDRKLPGCPLDTITVNCTDAVRTGVEHLISRGHKKIGFITGLLRISTSHERLLSYEDTMKKHGLYDMGLVRIGDSMRCSVGANLDALIKQGCTAIMIANNVMASEALSELMIRGINPDTTLELAGFKDSEQAQYGLQHMSLVCQPTEELGWVAGHRMLERLKNPGMPVKNTVLEAYFAPRKD